MIHKPVASSTIASYAYDPTSQTLEIRFQNGGLYQYHNVSNGTFSQFLTSPSKGKFLIKSIAGRHVTTKHHKG